MDAVVSGVSAIAELIAGNESRDAFEAVDRDGHLSLIDAAERAGVRRFVFVSMAGADQMRATPLARAKLAVEERLGAASLESVVVRPEAFQETWLSPAAGLDWDAGRLVVFGRGEARMPYVAVDDVAVAVAKLTVADSPPAALSFGGPEALTRKDVADTIERAIRRPMKRRHVPRAALWAGSKALAGVKPGVATLMGLGLAMDLRNSPLDAEPLRQLGIQPRPASAFIRDLIRNA